jgi:hypothetical protein
LYCSASTNCARSCPIYPHCYDEIKRTSSV